MTSRIPLALLSTTAVFMVTAMLSGCATQSGNATTFDDPWGTIAIPRNEAIKIGVTGPASPPGIAEQGQEQLRGAQLAVQETGHIRGFQVTLVPADSGCNSDQGAAAARGLIEETGIVAVIGDICNTACETAAPIFEQAHLTMLSPSCGAIDFTDQILHAESFMRVVHSDEIEGRAAARFAYAELGARRAGVISDGTLNTDDLAGGFQRQFAELGGEVVFNEAVASRRGAIVSQVDRIRAAQVDILYLAVPPDPALPLLEVLEESDINWVPVVGSRHFMSDWLRTNAGAALEGVYATSTSTVSPEYQALAALYESTFGAPPSSPTFALAYDATTMILEALKGAGAISTSSGLLVGRKALHDALFGTARLRGTTGQITCTDWGDCATPRLAINQLQNGAWVPVYVPQITP